MTKILPALMLVIGAGAGAGAGYLLDPATADVPGARTADADPKAGSAMSDADTGTAPDAIAAVPAATDTPPDYIAFNNQFIVPVVRGDRVNSLVVLALGVEIAAGSAEEIYRSEPKLRDVFLQVLFDHANMGGFDGRFTDGNTMDVLRMALTEVARGVIGPELRGVMITDIARQDV